MQISMLPALPFSRVRLCVTSETAAHQAPPSLGFSRQEPWSPARATSADPVTHLRRANSPRSSLTHAHARLDMAAAAAAGDSDSWGEEKLGGRAGTGRRWPQTVINATLFPQTRTRSQWKTRCGRWGAAALPAGTAGRARTRTRTSRCQGTSSSPQLLSIQELLPAVQESSWHSAQFIVHKSLIGFRRSPLGAAAEWIPSPKDQPSEPSLFPHEPWLLGLLPWPHSLCHSFCTGGTSFLFQ